jgi:hypothetical protein
MREASSVASVPTSARSDTDACWRSASICRWAVSRMRSASADARSRYSVTMAAPSVRASSRMRAASARAAASSCLLRSSAACASTWADSALAMPPWMVSVRSSSTARNFGST